ncbi:unnamed protein product [Paramecium pentaurelia]|uniref:Cullin-like alpha+beta domain-containing protein n=1 Tax=Paramecium pentaurelia TaxID=43138 RepID=A0A8S1V0Q6_9CILI|nr:unnamed protein product [Paramecium pentaurelia]
MKVFKLNFLRKTKIQLQSYSIFFLLKYRSNEDIQNFKETLSQSQREKINLDILVEQWPITEFLPLIIHSELLYWQQQFTQYYQCKNSKRKLTFNYRLGYVSLKAIFDQNSIILMHFNRQCIYKIDELIKLTNTDQEIMQSDWRILYRLNYSFIMKKRIHYNQTKNSNIEVKKLRFNQKNNSIFLQVRKSKTKLQEFKIDQKEIVLDRRVYLESLIVRVLIRKKQMDHKDLFIIKYNFKNQQLLAFIIDILYLYYWDRIIFIYRNLLFNLSMKFHNIFYVQQIAEFKRFFD